MKLVRCTVPHWQGDVFIPLGTIRVEGHREVIPEFFGPYDLETGDVADEPAEKPAPKRARKSRDVAG